MLLLLVLLPPPPQPPPNSHAARTLPAGLPQSLAKTKQALAMGYAVAALSSKDRDPEFRCFEWKKDSYAVAAAVR